ncbi:Response regulator of zinc sigma-54-dependent two-component system [hydrothermal vent metagenome]|uniref:Response regulator of zinc sigma-54-dependent two-component system n=1 Tax=hydrothermal vent metagenome TaxID=652676 RepID=A0A3B1CIP6_9ZZZZ
MSAKEKILIVDDDINSLNMVQKYLELKERYEVTPCLTFSDALNELGKENFTACVLDYFMPDTTGLKMMKRIHETDPEMPVIILTASGDIRLAIETIKEGAHNYLTKPVDPDELYLNLDRAISARNLASENKRLKLDLKNKYKFDTIIGSAGRMMDVFDLTMRAASVRSTVLITGETGAGKELIAKAIHYNSGRSEKPFIKVNCSAITETMLEAELFGIDKNVATGVDARIGKFEAADTGTIFLDEIGDMSPATQAKVLRALQEREIERVGSHQARKVNIRIIAATNIDLERAMDEGDFRRDLFYRLNVIVVDIPPLRERKEDIPALTEFFIQKVCDENRLAVKKVDQKVMERLMSHSWPGNVRELENTIERSVVMCDGDTLKIENLPMILSERESAISVSFMNQSSDLDNAVAEFERKLILDALERNSWRQNRAANELGVTERSMWYKIKKLGIDAKRSRLD